MYAKLIDGNLVRCKMPLKRNGKDIFTNDPTILLECGYKEVIFTNPPECDEEHMPVDFWSETETTIVQEWAVEPIPIESEEEIT